ncbi:S9 family peptidase [Amycolatopsis sp. 3B14]|uniref:S9 family peptidase n=1 Tax=Amycolatopsis sp. 3B14 TaxID=3243600 RepID=UPI003D97FE1F
MRPSDLELLAVPGTPALHGTLLLTAVTTPDLGGNTYRSSLWRAAPDGGAARQWTHGERDTDPAISPDGRWVAFLRADGDKPQLHVMPADGGDARRLTELPLGAGAPVWAPDSRRVAFTARVPEAGRYGAPDEDGEVLEPSAEAPRRITRYDYRLDNVGFLRDRPRRLFVLDVTDPGEPEPLTDDQADVSDPAWLPDGSAVLVVAPREWGATGTEESDLYLVPAEGGEPVLAVRSAGSAAKPSVTADGTILFYGQEYTWPHVVARNPGLWSAELPADGEPAKPRRLTDPESVYCMADVPPAQFRDEVLVTVLNRGAIELRAVPRDADRAPLDGLGRLLGERGAVRSFTVHGERIAAVVARPDSSGDVVLLDGPDQLVLTDLSKPVREKGIRPVEELTATAPDGYPVHGWLVLPEGDGPHPVLLVVHGGPFAAYDWGLFDEAQVYASAGYAVVMGNPRGSAGYGESHGQAIVHGLGTVDVDDVLALLDAALERDDLDSSRVGVMGGSYGGFMTTWLAAHHGSRFRAAWSERAVNAWDSFTGSSDIGWFFTEAYVGADPVVQRERSPLTYAAQIRIPFAVVHSEHDWRCPVEQAQRLFVELKRNGTEVEMLLFPGEGHELSRSGKPRHRVQRFDAILDWWSRHLA